MRNRLTIFVAALVGLLLVVIAASIAVADQKPRFFVIGEGNFEAFQLPSGVTVVANVPYQGGEFYNRNEDIFMVSLMQNNGESLNAKISGLAFSTLTASPDMVDCREDKKKQVKQQLEKGNMRSQKWKMVEIHGNRYALSSERGLMHPDGKKLIISTDLERELWIYNAENNRISIMDPNANLTEEPDPSGVPVFWFGRMFWSKEGKSIAYDSDKTHRRTGKSVWLLDTAGKDRCILDSKIYGPLNLLGWTYNNELIVARNREIGVSDLAGIYKPIGSGLFGLLRNAVSPTGERMAVMRMSPEGNGRGLSIVDFVSGKVFEMPPLPKGYFDNAVFRWSPDGKRLAFYVLSPAMDDPKMPYTTGAKLAVLKYLPGGRSEVSLYDSPIAGSSFYISSSVSWLNNRNVIGNLTNKTCVAMEVE